MLPLRVRRPLLRPRISDNARRLLLASGSPGTTMVPARGDSCVSPANPRAGNPVGTAAGTAAPTAGLMHERPAVCGAPGSVGRTAGERKRGSRGGAGTGSPAVPGSKGPGVSRWQPGPGVSRWRRNGHRIAVPSTERWRESTGLLNRASTQLSNKERLAAERGNS